MPTDFIAFAGVDWWYHNQAHSEFQILTRLARDRKVLIVNSLGMRMPMPGKTSRPLYKIGRKLRSIARLVQQPDPELPGLFVYSPIPWPFYSTSWSRRFGAWFVRVQVSAAARMVGIQDPAVFVTPPVALPVVAALPHRCIIYNRSDKHSLYKEADQELIGRLERELLATADLTIYANETLMEEERPLTGDRACLMDHGVDGEHFDADAYPQEPTEMSTIARPRIGFFGNLRSYMVNFEVFTRLAEALPQAQIVLVGDPQDSTTELERFDNIHLLGRQPYSEVAAFGAYFDVALVPYQDNDWIRYCNPIKMKEYLALGLPVVSTDFPEAHRYGDRIWIAEGNDLDRLVELVRERLDEPLDDERRRELRASVVSETWEDRAQLVAAHVERLAASAPTAGSGPSIR